MPTFKSLSQTATTLGVPVSWLKREANAGRVPCLRAGRRFLFDMEAVATVLAQRATADRSVREREVAR
jgi:hypothetical protein